MEYVERKASSGPLRVEQALKLAVQIASAMEEAHSKGILRRDLKAASSQSERYSIEVGESGAASMVVFGVIPYWV
jgi:eukaryotic-like serine/threonine-protein kinase